MEEKIAYLEKLLEGFRARYMKGEAELMARIRVTAQQLEKAKLEKFYADQQAQTQKNTNRSVIQNMPRSCCRGR